MLCIFIIYYMSIKRQCTRYVVIVSKYISNVLVMYHSIFEENLHFYLDHFQCTCIRKYHVNVLAPNPAIYQYEINLSQDLALETCILYIIFYI